MSKIDDSNDYSARHAWQSAEAAAAYRRSREPGRFKRLRQEESILHSWLRRFKKGALVLDVPCGTGRCRAVIEENGLSYIGADLSGAMIEEARKDAPNDLTQGFVIADTEHLPFADKSVDYLVMWRFVHHLRNERIRHTILQEAARVTRCQVLLSFHHPLSFTYLRKMTQRCFCPSGRHGQPITHWRLKREAESCGLRLIETKGFHKYVSINWFACLGSRWDK
ncbi:MAG: hypothetical protein DME26_07030 [Verrucomicrobia bacterium]|nr:MAG: hypothetical protein DME26_07030 [Verrucomicrobiota bacterium]